MEFKSLIRLKYSLVLASGDKSMNSEITLRIPKAINENFLPTKRLEEKLVQNFLNLPNFPSLIFKIYGSTIDFDFVSQVFHYLFLGYHWFISSILHLFHVLMLLILPHFQQCIKCCAFSLFFIFIVFLLMTPNIFKTNKTASFFCKV